MADLRNDVVAYVPRLRRYARSLTRDPDAADDLVQDCLLRAIRRGDKFRDGTNLQAWLFTLLHNIFIDGVRRSATQPHLRPMDPSHDRLATPPGQESALELRQLEVSWAKLAPQHRSALSLVALEGFSYEEVAAMTGVAVGTVKSRVSRAREALRRTCLTEGETFDHEAGTASTDTPGIERVRRRMPEPRTPRRSGVLLGY